MTKPVTSAPIKVAALYKFVPLPDADTLRPTIEEFCRKQGVRGTLLLAPEGINGTIAAPPDAIDSLVNWLMTGNIFGGRFRGAEIKYAPADTMPFNRMKVRLKSEIVTLRAPEADPGKQVGTYVTPDDWDDLIARDDVVLVDTRNDYEVGLGTFNGAIDPATKTFTEFKTFVAENLDPERDKKVAMFCTGGIRCEKASSYLKTRGFAEVFHLKGGILAYLEQKPAESSSWQGECFVFDERVAVGHGLEVGDTVLCRACRHPLRPQDRARPDFIDGVQCYKCVGGDDQKRRRAAARQRQMDIASEKGIAHLGDEVQATANARRTAKKRQRDADRKRNNS